MANGGKRPGAGRPKGSISKSTKAIIEAAESQGVTPLEVMLVNMRFYHGEAATLLARASGLDAGEEAISAMKGLFATRNSAQECAKDAAPYLHAKLQSTVLTGKDGGPLKTEVSLDEVELGRRLGYLLAQAARQGKPAS